MVAIIAYASDRTIDMHVQAWRRKLLDEALAFKAGAIVVAHNGDFEGTVPGHRGPPHADRSTKVIDPHRLLVASAAHRLQLRRG